MANKSVSPPSILLAILVLVSLMISTSASTWQSCRNGECMIAAAAEEEEFGMESEITRRILATSQYISYEALKRNSVPCSRRGASYYNCQAGGQANPYQRGCSAITRCRS
ncbi:hypothetical protein Syun_007880 [Stephania yunnanensis]|uniref:Uncharacterized protein n=1 Tax=Stephania yunnanensis TaxID=152371 RepID=A0AAP0L1C1_9MAGN